MNGPASLEKAVQLIRSAASESADLIVFPESWLPGYPVWLDHAPKAGIWDHPPAAILYRILCENSPTAGDLYFKTLAAEAEQLSVVIVMGAHERIGRSLYNSMIFFRPDGSWRIHRKIMPTYTERLIWAQGDGSTLEVIQEKDVRIGGLICWEHWMPLARSAMHDKNEHIHIAQWPMVKELHQLCSRHYAFEGQCFVIAAGCTLSGIDMIEGLESVITDPKDVPALDLLRSGIKKDEELLLKGGSSVISPDSHYLHEPVYDTEMILFAEPDLDMTTEGNLYLDTSGHYSRPDIFSLHVNERSHISGSADTGES